MELTLTGASLNSDNGRNKSTSHSHNHNNNSSTSGNKNNAAQVKKKCAHHVNNHSHNHSHGQAGKSCCDSHSNVKPPANFQSVESIPVDKLVSNPAVLFSALITCMKGGNFETFQYLVDIILNHERDTKKPMKWGISIYQTPSPETQQQPAVPAIRDSENIALSIPSQYQSTSALARRGPDGHTLSHWAAKRCDDIRFLQYLTSNVAHLHIHLPSVDHVGMTPLHWAATEGNIPMVNFILKHLEDHAGHQYQHFYKSSTNGGNNSSSGIISPLALAQAHQQDERPQKHHHHHPINSRDKSGCSPLLIAAQYGHADLAAFLIKRGADPHAVDDSLDTALHWAAYKGAVPVCGLLLHLNGIRGHLEMVDKFGQSPLHLASLRGHVDVVNYILEQADGDDERRANGVGRAGNQSRDDTTSITTMDLGGDRDLGRGLGNYDEEDGLGIQRRNDDRNRNVSLSFAAQLLTLADKDGKTPLDLAIKKKKPHAETVLRLAMDKYCTTNRSFSQTILENAKLFLSRRNWLSWLGLVSENGRPPKFIFWFVVLNLFSASVYELVVYAHVIVTTDSNPDTLEDRGRLWEYTKLHYATILAFSITWISLLKVHLTDPGSLATKYATSSNTSSGSINLSMDGCIDGNCSSRARSFLSSLNFFNENKRIKMEMHTLTNDLRNLYEETLESYASMDNDKLGNDNTKLPLCHSCHIAKPHRSKHCRVLNRCVLLFDHHCPFVGNTIGLYNYKYFYIFVISFTVAEILFSTSGFLYLKNVPSGTGREYGKIILAIYFSIYTIMTFGLSVYHTQLILKNLTTNEHQNLFRYKYLKDGNGGYRNRFHRGCVGNFISRFFPGKDAYTLQHDGGQHAASRRSKNSNRKNSIEIDMEMANVMTAGDKKNEEELSLVHNIV